MINNAKYFQIDTNIQVFPCHKIALVVLRYASPAHNATLRITAVLQSFKNQLNAHSVYIHVFPNRTDRNRGLHHGNRVILHKIHNVHVTDSILLRCRFNNVLPKESVKCQYNFVIENVMWAKWFDPRMPKTSIC